jgi:hypothetical protein
MNQAEHEPNVEWLIRVIRALPSDEPVAVGTPGYNEYPTQKAHWLGWLDPAAGTGSYPRKSGNDGGARNVYNRIVEPKMLLWLIAAAGVKKELADAAEEAARGNAPLPTRAAAIRKHVPWAEVAAALSREGNGRAAV